MVLEIKKEQKRVVIILDNVKIIGNIHIMLRARLTDFLNAQTTRDFIPVTNATVYLKGDKDPMHLKLLEVNKSFIKMLYEYENNM